MHKYCEKCKKVYNSSMKKCPDCGKKLKKEYSPEEIKKMKESNLIDSIITMSILN